MSDYKIGDKVEVTIHIGHSDADYVVGVISEVKHHVAHEQIAFLEQQLVKAKMGIFTFLVKYDQPYDNHLGSPIEHEGEFCEWEIKKV